MNKKTIIVSIIVLVIVGGIAYFVKNNNITQDKTGAVALPDAKTPVETIDDQTSEKNKEAFPKTLAGYERYVIDLPVKENEDKFEVEIIVGKTDKFDCNYQGLNGSFETKTVEGFGYDYYIFKSDGTIVSTMMGCPDETKTEKFVSRSEKVRYNSKLPVVVFAPQGFGVKYNVWSAGPNDTEAVQQ